MPRLVFLIFLLAAMQLAPGPDAAAAENGCVACHDTLPENTRFAGRHKDFSGSVHQRAGITCDACHAGDPATNDKKRAHVGVYPAGDPKSRVYFQNVPDTCGRCHTAQLTAFTQSVHYAQLKKSGKGPNCVTCHGSMATRVLRPAEAKEFCLTCHNERLGIQPHRPYEAEATLTLMEETRTLVDWAGEFAAMAKGRPPSTAEDDLASARTALAQARQAWHTFNLSEVRQHLATAADAARAAKGKLR